MFKILRDSLIGKGLCEIKQAIRYQADYESGMRLGWSIDKSELNKLPQAPGVLYLYDLEGRLCFLTGAHNLNTEAKKLAQLTALPKQLLRAVLSSASYKFKETESAFAAGMLEADEFIKYSPRFDPVNWHQRTASFLFIKKQGSNFLVSMGPLTEKVVYALGPIRGGKEVSIFVENMARAFDLKMSKKGLKLNAKQLEVALDYLKFHNLDVSQGKKNLIQDTPFLVLQLESKLNGPLSFLILRYHLSCLVYKNAQGLWLSHQKMDGLCIRSCMVYLKTFSLWRVMIWLRH